uniref:Uncharacterized protein n=1 Tax=Romanomermis culicivorax TaxID=13658 RepID=A0A915KCX9_ROMCU
MAFLIERNSFKLFCCRNQLKVLNTYQNMALVSHQRCNVLNGGGASSANGLVNGGGAANGLAPNAALINGANGLLNNALLNGANGKLLNGAAGLISSSSGSCNSSTSSSGANSADSNNSLLMPKHSYQNGGGGGNAVSAQLNAQPDRPIGYGAFGVVW